MVRSKYFATVKVALATALLSLSWSSHAAPLGLTLADAPDIASGFITVSYNAMTDTLSATGSAIQLYDGVATFIDAGGLFILEATVDGDGNMTGGTISIDATIASLGHVSGTLLTGVLTDFGFMEGGGDPLEFLFDVTGGDLASLYGPRGGIILSDAGFGGSFANDFANTDAGVSDTAAIPVPPALWLMFSALAGIAGVRRRK
ncbi:MAG: hypothetical protein OEQ74_07035 [Gammaproteobacteria bacterium]|nr:hypothetical protein [Gammaproteobacteria bacterium]